MPHQIAFRFWISVIEPDLEPVSRAMRWEGVHPISSGADAGDRIGIGTDPDVVETFGLWAKLALRRSGSILLAPLSGILEEPEPW